MTTVTEDPQVGEAPETTYNEQGLLIRPKPTETIQDVYESWQTSRGSAYPTHLSDVSFEAVSPQADNPDHVVTWKMLSKDREHFLTDDDIDGVYRQLKMPRSYMNKRPVEEREYMLNARSANCAEDEFYVIHQNKGDFVGIRPSGFRVDPWDLADHVGIVMGHDAVVRDAYYDLDEIALDVYAPEGELRYSGGDRAVGDITQAGVRIRVKHAVSKAPQVQPYFYRLVCTNGMEIEDTGLSITARNPNFEDEVYHEVEACVRAALDASADRIARFYEMRERKLTGDVTGHAIRLAEDAGLSQRVATRTAEALASVKNPTEFDLVNLITNQANYAPLSPEARRLQVAGGIITNQHQARCSSCHKVI